MAVLYQLMPKNVPRTLFQKGWYGGKVAKRVVRWVRNCKKGGARLLPVTRRVPAKRGILLFIGFKKGLYLCRNCRKGYQYFILLQKGWFVIRPPYYKLMRPTTLKIQLQGIHNHPFRNYDTHGTTLLATNYTTSILVRFHCYHVAQ